jgi:hypothetical protein
MGAENTFVGLLLVIMGVVAAVSGSVPFGVIVIIIGVAVMIFGREENKIEERKDE